MDNILCQLGWMQPRFCIHGTSKPIQDACFSRKKYPHTNMGSKQCKDPPKCILASSSFVRPGLVSRKPRWEDSRPPSARLRVAPARHWTARCCAPWHRRSPGPRTSRASRRASPIRLRGLRFLGTCGLRRPSFPFLSRNVAGWLVPGKKAIGRFFVRDPEMARVSFWCPKNIMSERGTIEQDKPRIWQRNFGSQGVNPDQAKYLVAAAQQRFPKPHLSVWEKSRKNAVYTVCF